MTLLSESTGQSRDRCLAALLDVASVGSGTARLEMAAEKLMREMEEDVNSMGMVWIWGLAEHQQQHFGEMDQAWEMEGRRRYPVSEKKHGGHNVM